MTIWKAGMLAVCDPFFSGWFVVSGEPCDGPKKGDVLQVVRVFMCPKDNVLALHFHEWPDPEGWNADEFRPAVTDGETAELIVRIKQCKPAPAQPHEAEALVPTGETRKPSRLASGVAAAGDATVSNTELVRPSLQRTARSHKTEPVTHRDLSQHADTCVSNTDEIVPVHEEAS